MRVRQTSLPGMMKNTMMREAGNWTKAYEEKLLELGLKEVAENADMRGLCFPLKM